MQVFVTINNVGMIINAVVNVKNWLIKVYVIRNIVGILVIVNVNVINHVILYLDYKNCKCRKKIFNKLTENVLKHWRSKDS